MNKLTKIAPIIVILAAAGSLFFVFKLDQKKKEHLNTIASLNGDLDSAKGTLRKTEASLRDTQSTLTNTTAELAQANKDLQDTKTSLEQKTQEAEGLKGQVAERDQQLQATKTELTASKDEMQKVRDTLQDVGFTNIQAIAEIKDRIQALAGENNVLRDGLSKMREENEQLKAQVVDLSTTPVNTRGRVADVQDKWSFVVLDIGEEQQVRKYSQFLIYRDNKPVGLVKILWVGPTVSVAEILPEYRRSTPRVGDVAVH